MLGIGDLADRSVPIEQCVATVRRALDAGLNLIDTAPGYEDGYSEQIVGAALKGRRDGIFVIDKIDDHDAPVAPQVAASVERLGFKPDIFVFRSAYVVLETFTPLHSSQIPLIRFSVLVPAWQTWR